ncbi:hypothetical protein R3P38DRAFT_3187618 [Favolaschia claudopus]|uniref:Uncharacterized protein n=1 Tax=Favolaschia claudopus TaxID=2862362 RepID=A0AAW0C0T0_9AGAR
MSSVGPPIPFGRRLACLQCPPGEGCAGFTVRDTHPVIGALLARFVPVSAHELCAIPCRHPWISHIPDDTAPDFFKGRCNQHPWDTRSVCVCGSAWNAHENRFPGYIVASFVNDETPPAAAVSASQTDTLSLGFSEPPVSAFRPQNPLFRAHPALSSSHAPGTVATRRTQSAHHSLPQHQGAVANSSAPHRGPRNPYPAASHLSVQGAASSAFASGSSPFANTTTFSVLIWPFTVPGVNELPGYPSPVFKISAETLLDFIQAFDLQGLCFHPVFPLTGAASASDFTSQLQNHLSAHSLDLPRPPTPAGAVVFHREPFVVLKTTSYRGTLTFKPDPTMNANTFTTPNLKKIAKKAPNPDPRYPSEDLFVIAMHFGPVAGALTSTTFADQPLPNTIRLKHPWFGQRLVSTLPLDVLLEPECYDGHCPEDVDEDEEMHTVIPGPPSPRPSTPPNTTSLVRLRSPGSQTLGNTRRVRPRQEPPPASFHENDGPIAPPASIPSARPQPVRSFSLFSRFLLLNTTEVISNTRPPPAATPPPPRPRPLPFVLGVDICPLIDVARWQNAARQRANDADKPLAIKGSTIAAVAECIILLLQHIYGASSSASFSNPPLIRQCTTDITIESFLVEYPEVSIGEDAVTTASGPGPVRAAFRAAAVSLTEDFRFWTCLPHSAFLVPKLNIVRQGTASRIAKFKAYGAFLALHCYRLGHAPMPVSLWLLLTFVLGKQVIVVPRNLLHNLDPIAYDVLSPLYDFHQDTPIPPASRVNDPLRNFFITYLDRQPSEFDCPRTADEHDALLIMAFATVLLGDPDPFNHAEYGGIENGFDIHSGRLEFVNLLQTRSPQAMLVTMFDRRIRQVSHVTRHLQHCIENRALDGTTPYFAKLFMILLRCYLQGFGHPSELAGGVVSEEAVHEHREDPLFRSNLLLYTAGSSDMRPPDDDWEIKASSRCLIYFSSLLNPCSSDSTESLTVGLWTIAQPLSFHSCFYEVDVKLDDDLQEILLAGVGTSTCTSKFGLWFHGQLLDPQYNAV